MAASVLSADFGYLAEQVKLVQPHVDLIHVDAMDAHFVPVLSIGPVVVESLRKVTDLPLHCHLMIEDPASQFEQFAHAGADIVTCHLEAVADPAAVVKRAEDLGMKAGLAVSPGTAVEEVFPYLGSLDRVLIMSVEPGWAGQAFLDSALPKIESVRERIEKDGLSVEVEVDGGINDRTGARCIAAGATVLAAASSIFKAADVEGAARALALVVGR